MKCFRERKNEKEQNQEAFTGGGNLSDKLNKTE